MARKTVALVATLLWLLAATEGCPQCFEVTQYFGFTANSTCGDPPTSFVDLTGEELNCSSGDHEAAFAVDGDNETWWQSENNADPVELLFTLQEPSLALRLLSMRFTPRAGPPLRFFVEGRGREEEGFTLIHVYVTNMTAFCDEYLAQGVPCSSIFDTVEDGDVVIDLSDLPMAIEEFRMIVEGYSFTEFPYRTAVDIVLLGYVADEYFAPSVQSIVVEGETGVDISSLQAVVTGSDESQFPDFQGQGYAVLEYSTSQRVMVQWLLPSLPRDATYQLLFHYVMLGTSSQRLIATVMQGNRTYETRVTLLASCTEVCTAFFSDTVNINSPAQLELSQGPFSIIITLSSVNILLDSITAVPQEFYNPTALADPVRFLANCNIMGNFELNTDAEFCERSAVQLSTEFYRASLSCNCQQSPTTTDVSCSAHGGQCSCIVAGDGFTQPNGRQCNICPFFSYITSQGCAACACPNPLDQCDPASGQCQDCPPLVGGLSCDRCVENSFGDPSIGCQLCSCDDTGTSSCNQTTGQCICLEGVAGASCDQCAESAFNFTSLGCTECLCSQPGSVGATCNEDGQCQCKPGVGGLKCSECLPGFYFLSAVGCTPCNCSDQSEVCEQDPLVTSEPSEICSCPSPYVGRSCEQCLSPGFFLDPLSDCAPCQCNGRAETCEDITGACISCTNDTTGDSCEVCMEEFFDAEPAADDLTCLECPCNTSTAFNSSCYPDASGDPVCFCLPGHEGPLCDTCSSGYFGQPPEFRCTLCDCNGNIDPANPGSCDMTTGVCLECINNSTGSECELCAPGFFGDATLQLCQECGCFLAGSISDECNTTTGQCFCLPGVGGGLLCDSCLPGFWNFTADIGCEPCDCAEGSTSGECDVQTGRCTCNEGINADDCSRCLDGFFNFSSTGCTSCECGIGAISQSCDEEGQCSCLPGVVGEKCDACDTFHTNLTALGCQPCGGCEQMLRADLFTADAELQLTGDRINLFDALFQRDVEGFAEVSRLEESLLEDVLEVNDTIIAFEAGLDALNATVEAVTATLSNLEARIAAAEEYTLELSPYSEEVFDYIQEVYNNMEQILISISDINNFVMLTQTRLGQQESDAENIARNISEIALLHMEDFSSEVDRLQALLEEAMAISSQAVASLAMAQYQRNVTNRLVATYEEIASNTTAQTDEIAQLEYQLQMINAAIAELTVSLAELQSTIATINATEEYASSAISSAVSVIEQAESALATVQEQTLPELETLVGIEEAALSGSGDGDQLIGPGSGDIFGSASADALSPIAEGLAGLRSDTEALENDLVECAMVVSVAWEYALELESQAGEIKSILQPSLTAGNDAVAAIIDFSNATMMIENALNLTDQTNAALERLQDMIDLLMTDELQTQVDLLLTQSSQLLMTLMSLQDTVAELRIAVSGAQELALQAEELSTTLSVLANTLQMQVSQLQIATSMTVGDVATSLQTIEQNILFVNDTYQNISSVLPLDLTQSRQLLNQTAELFEDANALLDLANVTVEEAAQAYDARNRRLQQIAVMADEYEGELGEIEEGLGRLRTARDAARQALASIDVALRFFGNSSLSYTLPPTTTAPTEFLAVSMVFRPSDISSGLLLATVGDQDSVGVSLQLNNGSVEAEYGSATVSTPTSSLSEEEWYQLYATREEGRLELSVASLQGTGQTYSSSSADMDPAVSLGNSSSVVLGAHPLFEGYSGCVDRVLVNNAQLPLLLPDTLSEDIATCGPRPPAEPARSFESGVWFQGAGSFLTVDPSTPSFLASSSQFSVEFAFRTLSGEGLLVQVFSENMARHIAVFLYDGGRVAMEIVSFNSTRVETANSYSTGLWYTVQANVTQTEAILIVNATETVSSALPSLLQPFNFSGELHVGGVSPAVQEITLSDRPSLAGCLRDLQVNSEPVDLQDNQTSARVSFQGCPSSVVPGLRCMGEGSLAVFAVVPGEEVQVLALSFRTSQLAAVLLQLETETEQLTVSVYHTRVRLDLGDTLLMSEEAFLNDNRWHDVTITTAMSSSGNATIELEVDGTSSTVAIAMIPFTGSSLTVGGAENSTGSVVVESLRGCLDNLRINERIIDFNDATRLEGMALFGCRPASLIIPSQPPPPPLPPPPSQPPNITVGLDGARGSFVAILISAEELIDSHLLVLQFQTVAALEDVLLLYVQDRVYIDYLALELQEGRLMYSYNLGSGRVYISSSASDYNDGQVHTVKLYRSGQYGEMLVDDTDRNNDSSPGTFTELNVNGGVLFVGGTPTVKPPTNLVWPGDTVPSSALACFHAFSINGLYFDLRSPQASSGAGQCLATYNNLATFGPNSFLQLAERFYAGVELAVSLDFATVRCSGLLLYTASAFHPDHLLLELALGNIRFVFDNGPGEVVLEYAPPPAGPSLCDGTVHTVEVRKEGVAGSLWVDGVLVATGRSPDPQSNFVAINTNDPLYLGGIPVGTPTRFTSMADESSFQGCLSNVFIQQGGAEGERVGAVLSQAEVFENVSFNSCTP